MAPRTVLRVDVACQSSSHLHGLVWNPSVLALLPFSAALASKGFAAGSVMLSYTQTTDPVSLAAAPSQEATRTSRLGTKVQEEELSPLTLSVCMVCRERANFAKWDPATGYGFSAAHRSALVPRHAAVLA